MKDLTRFSPTRIFAQGHRVWTRHRPATRPKVFGIGYPKTGTSTLGACLRQLGYKHHGYDMDLAAAYAGGNVDAVLRRAARYESFEDWPWHLAYRDLDAAFPGSRFIVTRRRDTATYVDSLRRHRIRHRQLGDEKKPEPAWWSALFPDPYGTLDLEAAAARYEAHYASIETYFAGREGDVLHVCWEEGDHWDTLCAFLGRPPPPTPFPHRNRGTASPHDKG